MGSELLPWAPRDAAPLLAAFDLARRSRHVTSLVGPTSCSTFWPPPAPQIGLHPHPRPRQRQPPHPRKCPQPPSLDFTSNSAENCVSLPPLPKWSSEHDFRLVSRRTEVCSALKVACPSFLSDNFSSNTSRTFRGSDASSVTSDSSFGSSPPT